MSGHILNTFQGPWGALKPNIIRTSDPLGVWDGVGLVGASSGDLKETFFESSCSQSSPDVVDPAAPEPLWSDQVWCAKYKLMKNQSFLLSSSDNNFLTFSVNMLWVCDHHKHSTEAIYRCNILPKIYESLLVTLATYFFVSFLTQTYIPTDGQPMSSTAAMDSGGTPE